MKAAVCREFKQPLSIEELDLAPPGAGEITVRVGACAICHSDIHYMDGAWGGALPAVFGHEAAGTVVETGPGVAGIDTGDRVVVTLIRSCGGCHYCTQGAPVQCESTFHLDQHGPLTGPDGEPIRQGLRAGAFAQSVTVHASQAVPVPKDLPFDVASLLACGVITGLGAVVNTAAVRPGSNVVVIGVGGVGLNSVQGAAICGAGSIVAVDISEHKLEVARTFGATAAVNARDGDLAQRIRSLTGGRGADYVFVTVGATTAVRQALGLIASSGAVVIVGMPAVGETVDFEPLELADLNQRIIGSKMGSARIRVDIPKLIQWYRQGRLKLDELISNRYPLDEINAAIDDVRAGESLRNVIVFDP